MPQIAKVAVAAATYAIDKPYDYLIPQGTDIAVGMRVLAPFGRGNRVSEGVVLALGQGVPDKPIKPIRSVVDREPVITDREIRLSGISARFTTPSAPSCPPLCGTAIGRCGP